MEIDFESVRSLIAGGIEFASPETSPPAVTARRSSCIPRRRRNGSAGRRRFPPRAKN